MYRLLINSLFLTFLSLPLISPGIEEVRFSSKADNVDATIHKDHGSFEIISRTEAYFKQEIKATINNSKARHLADIVEYYDGLTNVKIVSANVYNSKGDQIYKLKKSDIIDESSISGISVFEDGRIKRIDLRQQSYPYTIEYETLKEYQHTFHIPNWYVIPGKDIAVESSKFEISSPKDLEPRVYQRNIADSSYQRVVVGENTSMMLWEFKDVKPLAKMYYGKSALEYLPIINTSPSKFEYDGYQGDFSTWDDFAAWIERLNSGRNDLDSSVSREIQNLVSDIPKDKDRIRAVYEYLQNNTRYVSIQLGIGGYQPFLASTVHNEGYGDCKALSFYTKSLLESVGIDSKYVLISAGNSPRPIIPDFPQSNFNHAVLCVPNKGDTVWLECTSQTNPFGYMGSFTGNRDAFLIDNGKGKIVKTPTYDQSTNLKENSITMDIQADGNAKVEVKTVLKGMSYEQNGLSFVLNMSNDVQKKWMMENSGFSNFDLLSYQLSLEEKEELPEAIIESAYSLNKYARASGKRLFFELNPLSEYYEPVSKPDSISNMVIFELEEGVTKIDSVSFSVPKGYRFEYLPEGGEYKSDFGSFESIITTGDGIISFTRKLVLKRGKFPIDQYEKYLIFIGGVNSYEKPKVVLNKTT